MARDERATHGSYKVPTRGTPRAARRATVVSPPRKRRVTCPLLHGTSSSSSFSCRWS